MSGPLSKLRRKGPGRLRVALTDGPGPSTAIALPRQKTWPVALVSGAMFVGFAMPWISGIRELAGHRTGTVGDLAGLLFRAFWLLGWTVGVVFLFVVTLLMAFNREEIRARAGKLEWIFAVGPLRLVREYELARIGNVRTGSAAAKGLFNICFDYDGATASFARALPRETVEEALTFIRDALSTRSVRGVAPTALEAEADVDLAREPPEVPAVREEPPVRSGWLAITLLVAANLVPLAGVLYFDWDLAQIMVLFWAENAVVGFYALVKLAVIARWGALVLVPFFLGHFGGFMAGHLMFVYYLFVRGPSTPGPEPDAATALSDLFGPLWIAILAMFVSHGVSLIENFLGRREYVGRTTSQQMAEPYRRLMVMHVTLIFGGFAVMALGQPIYALLLLVVLKIAIDLYAHRREHRAGD